MIEDKVNSHLKLHVLGKRVRLICYQFKIKRTLILMMKRAQRVIVTVKKFLKKK